MPNTTLRFATFNLENFDDEPDLPQRIAALRPLLVRADADILALQEVHSQEDASKRRTLAALDALLRGTRYAGYARAATTILSRFPMLERKQYRHSLVAAPLWRMLTADPPAAEAREVGWERPILYCKLALSDRVLHVVNLHLKSKLPTPIPGQTRDAHAWKSVKGWAEGFFLSSVKRMGQALEARVVVDEILNDEAEPLLAVMGDFNADSDDVPVRAIRGDVADTGNAELRDQVLVPCEASVPESCRFSLRHQGKGEMIDHLLVSRALLPWYRGAEIYNEVLPDESLAFATDAKFPESDHAPVVGVFAVPAEWA